jgi:CheY-like chemotaxis protein
MIGLAGRAMPSNALPSNPGDIETAIRSAKILIVDHEFTMRKVVRTLLLAMGVTDVHDARDGASALAAVRALDPDVVLLDWQMPGMNGPDFVRRVRSPGAFPYPNVPIIMLTGHGEHSRAVEAMRLGVREFLVKPVSGKALHERLLSVLAGPHPMVKRGSCYAPAPRALPLRARDLENRERSRPSGLPARGRREVDYGASDVIIVE